MRKKSRPFRISQRAADGGIAVWMDLLNGAFEGDPKRLMVQSIVS